MGISRDDVRGNLRRIGDKILDRETEIEDLLKLLAETYRDAVNNDLLNPAFEDSETPLGNEIDEVKERILANPVIS
ncbi:MAG: hypothetical protein ACR2PX_27475 [Endozoicomonas sp.]|uniref:hypothetical protein n=1 Tax=Endozoicomonas sp. TaxID=1892382 RepID=UPI003D9B18A5